MRAASIRLVRVPARLAGAPRLRPALERWLADSDLVRLGFPPQAIVLVRQMSVRWTALAGDERAARYEALVALLAQARRPAAGELGADVIWFADEAELLACLARDTLSAALHTRWWWRLLLPGPTPRGDGVARWLQAARVVPHALRHLNAGRAEAWIAGWTPGEQLQMLHALAQAFPIAPEVVAYVAHATLPPAPPEHPAPGRPAGIPPLSASATRHQTASRARRLHRLCDDLGRNANAASAPAYARSLAARLADPVAATMAPRRLAPLPLRAASAAPSTERLTLRAGSGAPPRTPRPPLAAPAAPRSERLELPVSRAASVSPAPPAGPGRAPGADAGAPVAPRAPAVAPEPDSFPPQRDPPPRQPQGVAAPVAAAAARSAPAAFDTRHGGLLFVLNAALQLSLYGDFTRPLPQGLRCSPWRFLLLAGQAWCGPAFSTDPLAGWLAGRDAGTQVEPDPIDVGWRLPAPWLQPFAETGEQWRAGWRGGRLRLLHPAGFIVLDEAATPSQCQALLASEMTRLGIAPPVQHLTTRSRRPGAMRARASGHRHGCPDPLWPYLHARLALALGLGRDTKRRLAGLLLRLPARLHDSGQRVDLDLPLDALPLPVRLSGLDRDPGWIPAAGCDFRFHFH